MTLRNIAASMRHPRAARLAVAAGNVLASSALIGFIACSDNGVTEPAAPTAVAAARRNVEYAPSGSNWTKDFTYVPSEGTTIYFSSGGKVVLPAYSVCTTGSGYGATLWNSSCTAATSSMTFHVVASTSASGSPQFTVSPDVRFVPGKIAQLYLPSASTTPVIQWCTAQMINCVDEGASDKAMVTYYDASTHLAHRQIKHFSGYLVSYGKSGGTSASAQ